MLKSLGLFVVSFLTYGCTSNSFGVNNDNSDNSSNNYVPRVSEVRNAVNTSKVSSGIYNWQDTIDFDYIDDNLTGTDFTITFEPANQYKFLVPIWCYVSNNADTGYRYCYLRELDISLVANNGYQFDFFMYDSNQGSLSASVTWYDAYNLDDIDGHYYEIMINLRNNYVWDYDTNLLFNSFFTLNSNDYVISYTGYYNFGSNIGNLYNRIGVFGYLNFNNSIYLGFSNSFGTGSFNTLRFDNWNVELSQYGFATYSFPFDGTQVVYQNMLINGAKIPISVRDYMSNIGIFSFVRDDTNPSDFRDLLLTIADVPVYFVTQFLNFELFGFNLFVACASLVTLLVVIFVVRKLF